MNTTDKGRPSANTRDRLLSRPRWADDLEDSLPPLPSIRESATALRCSTRTVRRRIRAGLLEALKHGNRVVVPRAAVLALLGA